MIAIFAHLGDSVDIKFSEGSCKMIRTKEDLKGIRFSGVIIMYGFSWDASKWLAFQVLKSRQPELFDKLKKC